MFCSLLERCLHSNCWALRKSIRANGYDNIVVVIEKAVLDKPGSMPLFFSHAGDGTASLVGSNEHVVRKDKIVVEVTTLDEFFESRGWPTVHVIKMDIEGAEMAALRGMRNLLKKNLSLKLIMEFKPSVQNAVGADPGGFFDAMAGLGFTKFSALRGGMQSVEIPRDIPRLVQLAGDGFVNLLCER